MAPGVRAGEGRWALGGGEAAQVEVVDDLVAQVREVLDEAGAWVGVTGDAQPAQHELAELVGRRDGGRVEVGQRLTQPAFAQRHLLGSGRSAAW
jgi:hypothetical protein